MIYKLHCVTMLYSIFLNICMCLSINLFIIINVDFIKLS